MLWPPVLLHVGHLLGQLSSWYYTRYTVNICYFMVWESYLIYFAFLVCLLCLFAPYLFYIYYMDEIAYLSFQFVVIFRLLGDILNAVFK